MLIAAGAKEPSVTASATAGSDYIRPRDAKGALLPQTYVFAEGRLFGGTIRDGSLEHMAFGTITRTLAESLARQNYLPATAVESADLLIMVHWGTTEIYDDPMKEANLQAERDAVTSLNATREAGGAGDTGEVKMAMQSVNSGQRSQLATIDRNAILLGYTRSLAKEREKVYSTTDELTMSYELAEERYFVVLMAYDNRVRLKEKKSKPLWVTRLSMRAIGRNFAEALPALAVAGANIFGQQHDDLVRINDPLHRGSVKLGELEVLGTASGNETPPPKGK
jgi:hypothetical protein